MLFVDGRSRAFNLTLTAVVLATTSCAPGASLGAPVFPPVPAPEAQPELKKETPRSKPRTRPGSPKPVLPPIPRADSAALELAVTRQHAHVPLALALTRRTRKPEVAHRAASAVIREAERLRLSPSLLAAVLLIENAPFDTGAVSSQGAIGLMQIMPIHTGSFGCRSDLVNIEANICHGARLLKILVKRTGSMQVALKRYNGCVRGRNTPRCHRYPGRVLRTASRLRREVLIVAADTGAAVREALVRTDSVSSAGVAEPQCVTFLGCLRHRWTLTD